MHVHSVGADGLTAPELADAAALLTDLVTAGAALGWVDPPAPAEVTTLLREIWTAPPGDTALATATDGTHLLGLAYWRRYDRPTHRPHADVEKVAVSPAAQGHGLGRRLMTALIGTAREAGIEVLTLDLRADNTRAAALYESLGFQRYGLLPRFVAVGDRRYDKLFYALDLRRPVPNSEANPPPPRGRDRSPSDRRRPGSPRR